ncbi:MAG TPA: DsbC family protein [Azoarcus taiwanensis]|nr:DsbC family protein [Azoarcus taiwanensis]
MSHFPLRSLLASALFVASSVTFADVGSVRQGVEAFVGAPVVDSVSETRFGGLYEVVLRSGELVYTDANVSFIVDGRIIDTETRRDVTQARLTELASIDFSALPFDQAIKQVRGDGSRVIASFEDPNCGFCKRLAQELELIDDVTIYTFLYPILNEDSVRKSRNIWCASDQAAAWNEWILRGVTPPDVSCDSSSVDANVAFGQQMRIQGTPTMFLADGRRLGGYMQAPQLEQALSSVIE